MTYATRQDLTDVTGERELIELSDRGDTPIDWVDEVVVARALADADDLIDGFVAGQYTLPLTSSPRILVGVACDIARFKLWKDRASDEVRKRYDDALALLKLIAKGAVKLPDQAGVEPVARSTIIIAQMPERQFTRDKLRGF